MQLSQFHDYLYGLGRAERTIAEYSKMLRKANRWCARHGLELDRLDPVTIRLWTEEDVALSWASRKQARTTLRHYYRMLGRDADTLTAGIRIPPQPDGNPDPLGETEAHRLRDAALMIGGRKGMATLIGMYAASRRSEIAAIRWDGIDHTPSKHAPNGRISWWRAKRLDTQTVPMHPVLAQVMFDAKPTPAEGHVFAGNNGRPYVRPETVWDWVREVGRLADVDVAPHRLRATAGKMILEATGSIEAAAGFLGHSDLNVTRRWYTGMTSERRMAEAVTALDAYDLDQDAS